MDAKTIQMWQVGIASEVEIMHAELNYTGLSQHFHDVWSVGHIIEGECHFNSGGVDHIAPAGSIFIIPAYEVHACAAGKPVNYDVYYISEMYLKVHAPQLLTATFASSQRVWVAPDCVKFFDVLKKLHDEAQIKLWLDKFSQYIDRPKRSLPDKEVFPLRRLIDERWQEPLCLKDIESATKYSRWQAIRLFKKQVGLTPNEYLRQLRVLQSRHLIRQGTPLRDIAAILYFSDQPHFTRSFKRLFGVTPGEFRRVLFRVAPQSPEEEDSDY